MRLWIAGLLLAAVMALGAGSAVAATSASPGEIHHGLPGELGVRLLDPTPGAILAGGSWASLAWEPEGDLPPPHAGIDEWEAFLSLDGGRTYAIRITPHLDLDVRRISWPVPSIPSDDARLLLHLGNGAREWAIELPRRFSILPTLGVEQLTGLSLASTLAPGRGQAARPGELGVTSWVEGNRRGLRLHRVETPSPSRRLAAFEGRSPTPELGTEGEEGPPSLAALGDGGGGEPIPPVSPPRPRERPSPPSSRTQLALIQRLNE